jgi:hypothetical protein
MQFLVHVYYLKRKKHRSKMIQVLEKYKKKGEVEKKKMWACGPRRVHKIEYIS